MPSPLLAGVRVVAVGSTNPVKIEATRSVIARVAPDARVESVQVNSSVRDQPWGDDETIRGARTRADAARRALDADFGVGIEGGVVEDSDGIRTCAWAVVVDRSGHQGTGGSLAMPLPPGVATLLHDGLELGHAMDRVAGTHNVKQAQGAVGLLTAGLIDRQRAYESILTYALARWIARDFWTTPSSVSAVVSQPLNEGS